MRSVKSSIPTLIPLLAVAAAAEAYVGPGAGLSLLGALWGLVVAVGAALLFLLLWPLRRARRRAQARQAAAAAAAVDSEPDAGRATRPPTTESERERSGPVTR